MCLPNESIPLPESPAPVPEPVPESHPAPPSPAVTVEADLMQSVNYAMHHNHIPPVRSVTIHRRGPEPLEHLELTITATPELCLPWRRHIDYLPGGTSFTLSQVDLQLKPGYLAELTEKVSGLLHFTLTQGEQVLCVLDQPITVLAFDQWHGCGLLPELLAAFVTPNHPAVAQVNAAAANFLQQWTGDPSLDAYQTGDPERVRLQAGAIYAALQARNIVYAVAPASFESTGQRVRLCDGVLEQNLGNCLDLTLLYAACLEAVGLHPLLVLQPGHIFAGVWLEDLCFPESIQDDPSLLTKRLAPGIHQVAVCECTCFTAGRSFSFADACAAAEGKLVGQDPVDLILDVRRARLSGIHPLPQRVLDQGRWTVSRPQLPTGRVTSAPAPTDGQLDLPAPGAAQPLTRQSLWERKLLDLGLRNQLINLRLTKTMLPLLIPSLSELENSLNQGTDFSIHPRPADLDLPGGQVDFEHLHNIGSAGDILSAEFKNKRLRSAFTDAELSRALKELHRTARTALEENGANTLYLALGILRWYETPRSTRARYAPMILLPVELVRRSAAQGYVIRARDDEAQMNITMLEKMKQDFGITITGLDPLPEDDQGIDVRRVFATVRQGVMAQPRWDVLESAYLGIFSFSQFVMWNDIRSRSEDLRRSPIVRSLMDGRLCWPAQPMELGDKVPEDGVFLPLSADASQLFAIRAASNGESFVLHGPPGTGKSQTITALIANALAQGKTVLFVAEKMAALEVVQRRLEAIGIGEFCLELHSNKAKKRDVLDKLRRASQVAHDKAPEDYARKAEQLAALRQDLDRYAQALHTPQDCGQTVSALIGRYTALSHAPDLVIFTPEAAAALTPSDIDARRGLVGQLTAAARAVGRPQNHPLARVSATQYSHQLRARLPQVVEDYRENLTILSDAVQALAPALDQPLPQTQQDLARFAALCQSLSQWQSFPIPWCRSRELEALLSNLRTLALDHKKLAARRGELLAAWTPEGLLAPATDLTAQWNTVQRKWFLPRMLATGKFLKSLAPLTVLPLTEDTVGPALAALAQFQQERDRCADRYAQLAPDLGRFAAGDDTNWDDLLLLLDRASQSGDQLYRLGISDDVRIRAAGDPALSQSLAKFAGRWELTQSARASLTQLLPLHPSAGNEGIPGELALCDALTTHAGALREWCVWNYVCAQARDLGLDRLVAAMAGELPLEDVSDTFEKSLAHALIDHAVAESDALNTFSGTVFSEKVAQLSALDERLTDLTRQEIRCRLAARVPNFSREASQSSEVGILQRAIRSGGRGVSLRKLFSQIPSLLPRLCPCMLMSPISAAQYLDPEREPFSLVVFDEASQLTTSKAVGALARGRDAIIVGDPNQMPPTSFFAANSLDEDNLDTEDLESILDDCLALNLPQTHLLWHYRSRHESLIAFSNSQFYENRLYTFPSVNDQVRRVTLTHVDGVFDRGKTRCNHAEAEAIVAELQRRCADPALTSMSVGVVTFNISQQNLIEDLLTEACARDEHLDAWVSGGDEPLFIKNLENVQGDERDVILFSIGYGPDSSGRVYMNFGPLNREGGWRRLNVAVSRARQEMVVFSTLTPEQIDLGKTTAQGVAALKAFLEYAGGKALSQTEHSALGEKPLDSGVARRIGEHLAAQGCHTVCAVGRSGFRVDLAVVDPEDPEEYLLGILLDGVSYGASKTTRDREIAQCGVLRGLGWNLHRVWAMDWWDDPEKELAKITALISDLLRRRENDRLLALEAQDSPDPASPAPIPAGDDAPPVETLASLPASGSEAPQPAAPGAPYTPAQLPPLDVKAEELLQGRYTASLRARVQRVLAAEAPICDTLLIRRVLQSYGISRTSARLTTRLNGIFLDLGLTRTTQDGARVFWAPDTPPEVYSRFRCGTCEENRRDAKEIPVPEAANAVLCALYTQGGFLPEDLIRESAKLMGYSRTGPQVNRLFDAAITHCQDQGLCHRDAGGLISLTPAGLSLAALRFPAS